MGWETAGTDAAKRFSEKLIKDHAFVPEKVVTDRLGSHEEAALDQVPALENVKHVFVKSGVRLNNRPERDHEYVREKQRSSRGWRSPPGRLERLLRCRDLVRNVFKRDPRTAREARDGWQKALRVWGEGLAMPRRVEH